MPDRPDVLLVAPDPGAYAAPLRQAFPGVTLHAAEREAALAVPSATGLISLAAPSSGFLAAHPRLLWLQALTSGTDHLEHLPLPPYVTSMRGIHGPQMAELALLMMLALSRNFARMVRNQENARWERWPQPLLAGKTTVIVGLGSIAEALAARCAALGQRLIGVSEGRSAAAPFERIVKRAQLAEAAGWADFLVLLTPAQAETKHLVNRAVFAAMRPAAYVINLARGSVVDEDALIEALEAGRIAGAGLDVFGAEPLPPQHALWRAPNVIVTPHIGGLSACYAAQALPVLIENITHFLAGDLSRMRNLVRHP